MNIIEIIDAWITSFNPSEEDINKANVRASICENCEFKKEINPIHLYRLLPQDRILNKFKCSKCSCPLSKKIFSHFKEGCPINKWPI